MVDMVEELCVGSLNDVISDEPVRTVFEGEAS
jgi:hypothetical protein